MRYAPIKGKTLSERFWEKVDIRGEDECWPWLAGVSSTGYGGFSVDGKVATSHTVAYTLTHGPIPDIYDDTGKKIEVCHSCHNRLCCNGKHLSLGWRKTNAEQMADAGRHVGTRRLEEYEYHAIAKDTRRMRRKDVAEKYGISRQHVDRIISGYLPKIMRNGD